MTEEENDYEEYAKALNVPARQVEDAFLYLRQNPIFKHVLVMRFSKAIEREKNALITIEPDKLLKTQGIIAGLQQGQGIIKSESGLG